MRTYDVSNRMDSCEQTFPCTFKFDRGSPLCIVIAGLESNLPTPDDVPSVSYTIKPRKSFYWTIVGSIFAVLMVIGIIVPVVLYLTFRRKSSYDSQRQPILPATSGPPSINPS